MDNKAIRPNKQHQKNYRNSFRRRNYT